MPDDEVQASVQNSLCAPCAHVTGAPSRAGELGQELASDPGSGAGVAGEGSGGQLRVLLSDGGSSALLADRGDVKDRVGGAPARIAAPHPKSDEAAQVLGVPWKDRGCGAHCGLLCPEVIEAGLLVPSLNAGAREAPAGLLGAGTPDTRQGGLLLSHLGLQVVALNLLAGSSSGVMAGVESFPCARPSPIQFSSLLGTTQSSCPPTWSLSTWKGSACHGGRRESSWWSMTGAPGTRRLFPSLHRLS